MPRFFLLGSNGNVAGSDLELDYDQFTDGLYIGSKVLSSHGWSADEFLRRPDWQRQLVRELQVSIAHEMVHYGQARRSLFGKETWALKSMEIEYEAYAVQSLYVHEMLKADPRADIDADPYYDYVAELDNGLLKSLADRHDASYPQNHHVDGPRWRQFRDGLIARWPAFRVEGYMLLAERGVDAPSVKQYHENENVSEESFLRKARAAAKAAGLPDPAPGGVVPARPPAP